jgi:hypothetical protein
MDITPALLIEEIGDALLVGEIGQTVLYYRARRIGPGILELDYEGCPMLFRLTIETVPRGE